MQLRSEIVTLKLGYRDHSHAGLLGGMIMPVGLWRKLARAGRRAGRQVAEYALLLHYTAQNPETPAWARQAAYGALAYFVLPTDAIPDWLAGMGYTDDLGVLAAALATLSVHVDDQARAKTATRMRALFGEKPESDRSSA